MTSWFQDSGTEVISIIDILDFMIINFIGQASLNDLVTGFDASRFDVSSFEHQNYKIEDLIYILKNVTGAVAEDNGTGFTTETTEATEDTADDMTLLPATPAVNDAYYFAGDATYRRLRLLISTPADWVGTIIYEYSKGSSTWGTLTVRTDEWNDFKADGYANIRFDVPGDWATDTVNGIATKYWVRARVSVYTSVITSPKGTRVFTETGL